ncbi:MAG: ComEC/Rec2 family competence protein [Rhodospirillaceae bacterium]
MLQRDLGVVRLTGRVIVTESMPDGVRITLSELRVERLAPEATPNHIRLQLKGRFTRPSPGAMVSVLAMLHSPSPPAEPGSYDFQRQAYFDGNGGVGYVLSEPVVVEGPLPSRWRSMVLPLERVRAHMAARCAEILPDKAIATVTAALLNGEQTGIPPAVMNDYRYSGLAHLLSISGLHIALVAGLVFFVVRALLALIEPLALRFPIKKWAALTGLLTAFGYMMVVGTSAPTVRSVLMTGTVMLAIMLDRNPMSMRLLAVAALVILIFSPEQMMGPSFQMSFAAVGGLIAVYEAAAPIMRRWRTSCGILGQAGLYVAGSMLTSVVATVAVTPFSLFHFQQDALYGVLSNMIAVPLTSFWVMPWALVVYLLMPFGLDAWALTAMGWGVAACNWLAHVTAALPGAVLRFPAMPVWGLTVIVLGGLWLMLWSSRWRLWGAIPIMIGLASVSSTQRPDILVSADGSLMAVRMADGGLSLSRAKGGNRLTTDTWLHRDGTNLAAAPWPDKGHSADGRLACDQLGCLYRAAGQKVALVRERLALEDDCDSVDLVIAAEPVRHCGAPRIIDMWALRSRGAHAVFLANGVIRIEAVGNSRGQRPWTVGDGVAKPRYGDAGR